MDNLPDIVARWLPAIAVLLGIGSVVNFGVNQVKQAIKDAVDEINSKLEQSTTALQRVDLSQIIASGLQVFIERQLRYEVGETNEQAIERWMSRRYGFEDGTTEDQEMLFTMRDIYREQGKIPKAK